MKFYLDENLSEYVAQALNLLNKGYFGKIQVESTKLSFGKGVSDEDLIPEIGKQSAILITRDLNISKTQAQFTLCKDYNLGAFFIKLPKNSNRHWDIVKSLIYHWEDIIEKSNNKRKPFAFLIHPKGKIEEMK